MLEVSEDTERVKNNIFSVIKCLFHNYNIQSIRVIMECKIDKAFTFGDLPLSSSGKYKPLETNIEKFYDEARGTEEGHVA